MLRDSHFRPGGISIVIITIVFTYVERIIVSSSYGNSRYKIYSCYTYTAIMGILFAMQLVVQPYYHVLKFSKSLSTVV